MQRSMSNLGQKKSPLLEALRLPRQKSAKKPLSRGLALALPLTSLIDAFSIIVIYLLIGTQTTGIETAVPKNMTLPSASHSVNVNKVMATLRIQKGNYFLNEKSITVQSLTQQLTDLKKASTEKEMELMIQADQEMQFAELDPLIKAGSLAGIEKLKFAVMPTK